MNTTLRISDFLDALDPDELWLIQEELAELGETEIELEEVYRQLAAAIADGKPLRTTTTLYDEEIEDDYEQSDV